MKKLTNYENRNAAFTLAETLITVVILGILAAILVPNLIKNQVENANRTKVKKAMAAYEKAINFMIVENDIKSTEALRELGQDNCQYTKEYFKTVQDGENNCIFKTADRVWWDITDITNPLISLKDEITDSNKTTIANNALSLEADKTSFALVGRFDEVGSLRVDDNGFEQSQMNNMENKKYMVKLWSFATNAKIDLLSELASCKLNNVDTCTVTIDGKSITYTKIITNTDTTVNRYRDDGTLTCIYNRNGNPKQTCSGYTSAAPAGEYWITASLGGISETEAKDMTGSVCTHQKCIDNGDYYEAAKRKCEKFGGRLPNLAELEIAKDNGKLASAWWVFASEEVNSYDGYVMNREGTVAASGKFQTYSSVICVGE